MIFQWQFSFENSVEIQKNWKMNLGEIRWTLQCVGREIMNAEIGGN